MFPTEDEIMLTSCKVDSELYDEESYVVHKLINVRRVALPQNGEDWEILEDNQVVFTVKGVKLTKKQKQVLRTVDGIYCLMNIYKTGKINVNRIKKELSKLI